MRYTSKTLDVPAVIVTSEISPWQEPRRGWGRGNSRPAGGGASGMRRSKSGGLALVTASLARALREGEGAATDRLVIS